MAEMNTKKILFVTSTLPSSDTDSAPAFVKDEAIWFKKIYPHLDIIILAPHSAYTQTKRFTRHEYYDEYRFHYFWPFKWEKLAGRGIQPALKKNKWLYFELPGIFIAEFFATWRLVKKLKPAMIYAHWFTPQAITGALVAKITNTPFVFDSQASDIIVLKVVPFSKRIVAAICNVSLAYTMPSQQTVDKLLYFTTKQNREAIKSKLHMIPLGTAPVPVNEAAINAARQKYHLEDTRIIYFIGRLVDRKGIDVLVKSFKSMSDEDSNLRLVIVGDGQERDNLVSLVHDLQLEDKVIFAGYINGDERFALLQLADVCAVPSVNVGDQAEGLPIVFMEGVTAGKVVVVTDATGAHEIVQDGQNAFVATAGSVESLTTKLREALEKSSSGDPAFKKAVAVLAEQFQWPSIIRRRFIALKIDRL
jgi:glycosyltransferase involved in cell wall biosynthesis